MTTFRTQRLFHDLNRQEYRFVIQNQGATPTLPAFFDATNFRSKFFHRGCHGWIESIELFIRNAGVAQNVTIGISNFPGATEDSNYTALAPPGDNWVSFIVQIQWNYDALFLYVRAHGANTSLAWDVCTSSSQLPDAYYSTTGLIAGPYTRDFTAIDPTTPNRRYHIRVYVSQSVGDVPVTGFVNIKEIDDFITVAIANELGQFVGIPVPTTLATDPQTYDTGVAYIDPYSTHTIFDLNPWHATEPRVILWLFLEVRFAAVNLDYPFLHYNENIFFELDDGVGNTIDTRETKKETSLSEVPTGTLTLYFRDKWEIVYPYYVTAATRVRLQLTNYTFARMNLINATIFYIPIT